MTERDLNDLDKRINQLVTMHRKASATGAKSQPSAANADAKSQVSRRSVPRSMTSAQDLNLVPLDVDKQIITANHCKVIGMTSAEWNNQVQKNVAQWQASTREKQQLLHQQREQMRSEL